MVKYGKEVYKYNIGDTVYIYWFSKKWTMFKIKELGLKNVYLKSDNDEFVFQPLSTIALTEHEYKELQQENKFMTSW